MKKLISTSLTVLFLFLVACDKESLEPETLLNERSVRTVDTKDIPEVMSFVGNSFGLKDVKRSSASLNGTSNFTGSLNLDRVLEIVDTLSNSNYSFLVNDEDGDPFTFTNLIIKRNADGDFYTPFVLEYTVDSAYRKEFILSNYSMAHFSGMVVRRYFKKDGSGSSDYRANLENTERSVSFDENCDEVTYYSGGGSSDGPPSGDTSSPSGDSGTSGWSANCVQYYEDIIVDRVCPKYIGEGSQCVNYYISVLATNCGVPPSHTEVNDPNNCPSPGSEEIGIIIEDEEFRMIALEYHMELNPHDFLNIPCEELEKWLEVARHKPNQSVLDKLEYLRGQNTTGLFDVNFNIQTLESARGTTLNMDYFSVTVTELPNGMTANHFLNHIRTNINDFINTNLSNFQPYNLTNTNTNENALWLSNNPLGTVLHIDIPGDPASVICSDFNNQQWKFSTITSPGDYIHPVSGTREFGYKTNPDGSYTFYTRGVDRVTLAMGYDNNSGLLALGDIIVRKVSFNSADNLWKSLQSGIESYVNNNGGYAFKNNVVIYRPDYLKIQKVLNGEIPISDLGCD